MVGHEREGTDVLHDYRKIAETVYDIFSRGAVNELPEVFASDFIEHEQVPGSTATGIDAVAAWVTLCSTAFPDARYRVDSVVGEGHQAVCRVQLTGTHTGEFLGAPATGNPIDVMIIDWVRLTPQGKVAEHWGAFQESRLMEQVGLMPAQAPTIDLTQRIPQQA